MIKYKLICNDCKLIFDSWFASSLEYEKLKKKNFLNCINCSSEKIEKTLMTPHFINNTKEKNVEKKKIHIKDVKNKIKEYQKFIKNNFEYVGKNFAYEARTIHYKNKKKDKGIYGTASREEIKEIKEEGINTEIIPWVKDENS